MSDSIKYEMEYLLNASPSALYPRLSTPSGLSDWFADDVNINGNKYTFFWDGSEQEAILLAKRTNVFIRFKWLDDESDNTYFEFRLETDDLTSEVALVIVDFAEEDEIEDAKELWDTQIEKLKHNFGL